MNKKITIVLGTILLLAAGYWLATATRCAQENSVPKAVSPLFVGTNVGYPPFVVADETGNVIGFDADVAAAIAQKLHRPLIIKDMAFDALLLALANGSLDMIIGGLSITNSRKKTGLLVPHYGEQVNTLSCFYPAGKAFHRDLTLADIAAQRLLVCTQAGSVFEDILGNYPGITVKTLPDISDLCFEVLHGESDMGILDVDSVRAMIRTQKELAAHTVALSEEETIDGFGIGISPKNPALRIEIENAIATLKADGTMAALAAKWFR